MAVTVTLNVPPVVYVWLTGLPEPELASPKFQLNVNGLVPPVFVAVKVTGCPVCGFDGAKLKSTAGAGLTVTGVTDADAVTLRLSVAVTVAVKDPAAA